MADTGLGILSGLLGGLQGLPQGMVQREKFDQTQQQLDEQRRQFDEGRFTDLSTIAPLLKAGGMDVSALPAGKVPNTILPALLSMQAKRADLAEKDRAAQELSRQVREMGTTTTMAPGASLSMAQPGDLMTPPPTTPMPPISQQTVDPGMERLAKMIPGLLRTDPAGATAMLKDTFAAEKPQLVNENTTGVYTRSRGYQPFDQGGGPSSTPTPPPPGMVATYNLGPRGNVKGTTLKPIEARDDFDRAAFGVTQGRVQRYEDLTPADRARADAYVKQFRGDIAARQGEAGTLGRQAAARTEVLPPSQAAELSVPYGTTQEGAYGKTPLTTTQQGKVGAASSALAIIDGVEKELKNVMLPSGPVGRILQAPQNMWGVYAQGDPTLTALDSRIQGTLSTVIRALGEVGTLSDKDIARAKALWPRFVPIPDSAETVAEKMRGLRELVQEVGSRAGVRPGAPGPATPGAAKRRRYNPQTGVLE